MKVKISDGLMIGLIVNLMYAKAIGVTQGAIAREVGADMWLSTLFAVAQGSVAMFIVVQVIKRQPSRDLVDHGSLLLGRWFGKVVSLLLFAFFLAAFGPVMITFVYHLMDYFLPEAPTYLFVMIALLVGGFGAYHGLEVMARMAFFGLFSILLLNILLLIGSFHEFDIGNVLPLFDSGVYPVLKASRHHDTDWAMATMMTAIVLPKVNSWRVWHRSTGFGIVFAGFLILMWPIMETGVLSAEVASQYVVSCMQLARSAHIGNFIHRYEMIMVAFFATSAFTQVMMSLFCASHAASKLFGLKDYRPMLLPTCLVLGGFGYWIVADHMRASYFLTHYWPPIALSIAVLLPLLLFGLGFLFKRKYKTAAASADEDAEQPGASQKGK